MSSFVPIICASVFYQFLFEIRNILKDQIHTEKAKPTAEGETTMRSTFICVLSQPGCYGLIGQPERSLQWSCRGSSNGNGVRVLIRFTRGTVEIFISESTGSTQPPETNLYKHTHNEVVLLSSKFHTLEPQADRHSKKKNW